MPSKSLANELSSVPKEKELAPTMRWAAVVGFGALISF